MTINWFTVGAQLLNFLLLVWLLKKFLYKPVLEAIDAREHKITARLDDAKNKKADAKKEHDAFAEKNEQFDAQKKAMMDKAIADTQAEKDKLLDAARQEVKLVQSKQLKAVADMHDNLKAALAEKTQAAVFNISRKALTDLASVELEGQAVKVFIERLEQLKGAEEKLFTDAFASGSKKVLLQSAFELNKHQQTAITKAVDNILDNSAEFEFKTAPQLVSGIELSANGYKLSWSITAYLDAMQTNLLNTLEDTAKPEAGLKQSTAKKQTAETATAQDVQ